MFVDGHKQPDVVKDCERFLKTIEKLKLYIVEFNEDGIIKDKEYSLNCAVSGGICQPIIVIIHNKYMFFANNNNCKA